MGKAKHELRKARKAKKKLQKQDEHKKDLKWLWLALALSFISYGSLYDNETTNYDDDIYVTENSLIQRMELGTLYSDYYWNQYSPLAMTIMGVEYSLFDDNEVALRVVSVLIHLACVFLIFLIIRKLFKDDMVAGLTALLFGVHPMQVESVAWLTASMKIGTYALFFLWSIHAYISYLSDDAKKNRLLLSLILFIAACLCKEQAVILPIVLILIDYLKGVNPMAKKEIFKKLPFFVVSIIFGIVTLKAAQGAEPVEKVYDFVLAERVLFAFYSTGMYLLKLIIPADLSMFYTYPTKGAIPSHFYAFPLLVGAVLYVLYRAFKEERKWLVFGIAFFFINVALTAMTSILSVRDVIMADRYVYLPAIGVFFILTFGTSLLAKKNAMLRYIPVALALIYAIGTYQRVDIWQNSITLFSDVIEKGRYKDRVNPYLALAYNNRGISYKRQGDLRKAIADYESAIEANPNYPNGYLNRGNIHFDAGEDEQALTNYDKVLSLKPDNAKALSSRGAIYAKRGRYDEAIRDLTEAIRLDNYFLDAYSNRALTYMEMGKIDEAIADVSKVLEFSPSLDDMYEFRGYLHSQNQDLQSAIADYGRAIALNSKRSSYYYNRALAYRAMGNKAAAIQDANKARSMGHSVPQEFFDSLR